MSVRYFIENILLYNDKDTILVSPKDGEWVKYHNLEEELLNYNVENVSCVPDCFTGRQIWHIYLW